MAPNKSSKKLKQPDPSDSPITVGGGGGKKPKRGTYVEVNFDHNVWVTDPQQNDNNVNEGFILDYFQIDTGGPNIGDPIDLTATSRLDIRYTNGGTYSIKFNDTKTGVRFNRGRLPYVANGTHHGDNLTLKDYRIDNNPRVLLPPNCKVYVHTKTRPPRKR